MTIKDQGGIFGRNPTFNSVSVSGSLTASQIVGVTPAVLSDVDLSVTDIRLSGGTPIVITGIDQFREIILDYYGTAATLGGVFTRLSIDGGANFLSGASDYSSQIFSAASATLEANAFLLTRTLRPTIQAKFVFSHMGNPDVQTSGFGDLLGSGGSGTVMFRVKAWRAVAEVNNAMQLYSEEAHTSGRLVVTGIY